MSQFNAFEALQKYILDAFLNDNIAVFISRITVFPLISTGPQTSVAPLVIHIEINAFL